MNNQLYGWEVSPFTQKVHAYLKYKEIPFKYKNPTIITYKRKLVPAVGKLIMPITYTQDNEIIQDSTELIAHFEELYPEKSVTPSTPQKHLSAMLVELFADEWLPMASLHYRWNYKGNKRFIISEFGNGLLPWAPKFIQREIGKQVAKKMSGFLPILGITENTQDALEVKTEEFLSLLNTLFQEQRFLLGDTPCVGDFAIYGQLYAQLHRDPYPKNLIRKHPFLYAWLESLRLGVTSTQAQANDVNDKLHPVLLKIMEFIVENQMPLIKQTLNGINDWSENQKASVKIPKVLGDATINLNGIKETRYNLTYSAWMFQRIYDAYLAMNQDDKKQASVFLKNLGLSDLFHEPLKKKVEFKSLRLYLA